MFPVTFLCFVLSVLFAFCGLLGGVAFFLEAQQGMSLSAFLGGFATATWPLIAACVLLALQQILKELHALREATENAPAPQSHPATAPSTADPAAAPTHAKPAAGPVYFPVRETPEGPRIVRPAEPAPATPQEEQGLQFFKVR